MIYDLTKYYIYYNLTIVQQFIEFAYLITVLFADSGHQKHQILLVSVMIIKIKHLNH
jgi:hypothetical protein